MSIIPSNLNAGVLRANEGEQYIHLGTTALIFKSLATKQATRSQSGNSRRRPVRWCGAIFTKPRTSSSTL
jgi:hypothetical protein